MRLLLFTIILFVNLGFFASCTEVAVQPSAKQLREKNKEAIETYLRNKGLSTYDTTTGGVYVVVDSARTGTKTLSPGRVAYVRYKGRFLDRDTVVFDSTSSNAELLRVVVGTSSGLIAGFSQGLPLLKEGEVGRLFIPSQLAYGTDGASAIPANSNLIFTIKVVSVQ